MPTLRLKHPTLKFSDLFTASGLAHLDQTFIATLQHRDPDLHYHLQHYRTNTLTLSAPHTSALLIQWAQHIEQFLTTLFDIESAAQQIKQQTQQKNPIATFRKNFLLTKVKRLLHNPRALPPFANLHTELLQALQQHQITLGDLELEVATLGLLYLQAATQYEAELGRLAAWCAQALRTPEGRAIIQHWSSFYLPELLEHQQLIPTEIVVRGGVAHHQLPPTVWRERDGFNLTDQRMSAQQVQNEIHYCLYCHEHTGDFCSTGFPVDKKNRALGFRKNPLDVTLTGCPLEERISEMHQLKRDGYTIAALAMIMRDNPMCPATGHRICNDCMKACIYQKQVPVNIPQIETRVLTDVLALPWGVEIYDLLTKWNPLRPQQWVMQPYNGKKIMIAGQGPAGFTLAHHLLQEGCAVVGFDGLKIEPLPAAYCTTPIYDYQTIATALEDRLVMGFGGVAEYGITVRWDKNFLKLIYLSLVRRPHFQVFGSLRFGGTLTVEDAWHLGFDHFVIAVGAGLPKALPVENSMALGMRQANGFLMALQLTGAAKKNSFTALEIRLPVLVIGGGLTGVDAATEAQAYYIRQVEKVATCYAHLRHALSEAALLTYFGIAEQAILNEFLTHAAMIAHERQQAQQECRAPHFIALLQAWGGVSIVYRKTLQASPAYINNHEELHLALQEGIFYVENLTPLRVNLDTHQHCQSMTFQDEQQAEITLPAKSILVATGASLNVAYAFEHPHTFERNGLQYTMHSEVAEALIPAAATAHCKDQNFGPFTSYHADEPHRVTFIGDAHPIFHGSVVKAIASATYTYPKIMRHLRNITPAPHAYADFHAYLREQLTATVVAVETAIPQWLSITIHAPQAVKNYQAGQLYKLQAYGTDEGCWLHASDVDYQQRTLHFTLTAPQATRYRLHALQMNDAVALMGPTGVRSKVSEQRETILILGNQESLAYVHTYLKALKAKQHCVIFLGYFQRPASHPLLDNIVQTCDYTLFADDCLTALKQYAEDTCCVIPFKAVDRLQLIGTSNLLKEIVQLQKYYLKDKFSTPPKISASAYAPMQCLLKGVCAQCLQWQIDPETGRRTKAVFACSWQDQPLELLDLEHLAAREKQNSCQETLYRLYQQYN